VSSKHALYCAARVPWHSLLAGFNTSAARPSDMIRMKRKTSEWKLKKQWLEVRATEWWYAG